MNHRKVFVFISVNNKNKFILQSNLNLLKLLSIYLKYALLHMWWCRIIQINIPLQRAIKPSHNNGPVIQRHIYQWRKDRQRQQSGPWWQWWNCCHPCCYEKYFLFCFFFISLFFIMRYVNIPPICFIINYYCLKYLIVISWF